MASETFGVREFSTLILLLLQFYLRHKNNIDGELDSPLISALGLLVSNIDTFENLNPPGPI